MPPVLAALTAIGSAISGALATTYLGIQLGTWIAGSLLVYGQVQQKRAKRKARNDYNAQLADRMVTYTDANAPWQVVYGDAIVGGRIVAQLTSGDRDQYQHVVVEWADHECDAIPEVLLAGVALGALDSNGYVTSGKYFKTSTAAPSATVTLDGAGSATLPLVPDAVLGMTHTVTTEGSGTVDSALLASELIVAGAVVTVKPEHVAEWAGRTVSVAYRSGAVQALVRVRHHLGAAGQTADTLTMAECPTDWTATDVLAGKCYSIFRFTLDEPEFQGGPPLMQARVRGKKVYDHRTDTTAWSANAALCVADFLRGEYGKAQPSNALLWASVDAAANVCDEVLSIVLLVPRRRYTCNGAFSTDADPDDTLTALCQAMAGFATFGGAWHVQAGAYSAPVMALTEADNMGSVEVIECAEGQEMVNGMRGQFYDKARYGQRTDYSPYSNAALVAVDDGEAWGGLNLPFTDSNWRAHNLARIQVERSRGMQVVYPAKLRALALRVGQRLTLSNAVLNLDEAVFRVVRKNFRIGGPVLLTLAQDDPSYYDEVDAPGDLASPTAPTLDPWVVDAVMGLTAVSSEGVVVRDDDGTVISRARLAWTATTDPYVLSGGALQVELRLATDSAWTRLPEVNPHATQLEVPGLQDQRAYVVQARWRNALGQLGDWAPAHLLTAAPSELSVAGVTAALAAAEAAQDAADAAQAEINDIVNDAVLSRDEKPGEVLRKAVLDGGYAGIDASAAAYGVTTERTAYTSALSALGSYLDGLIPAWNDSTQNTPIVRSTYRSNWAAVYTAQQALLNKVAEVAGTRAAWANLASRPADAELLNAYVPIGKGTMNADPGCEYGTAWGFIGDATLITTTSSSAVGRGAIRFGSGSTDGMAYTAETIPVNPARRYRLTARLLTEAGNDRDVYVVVRMFRADNTELTGADTGWGGSYAGYVYGGLASSAAWAEYGADFGAGTGLTMPADVAYLRVGVWGRYSGTGSSGVQQYAQDVRLVEVTEVRVAQAAATAAAGAASDAQDDADAANATLANIASDNVLTRGEKPRVILDWTAIAAEQAGIDARATAYGITTEKTAYDSAITTLDAYLVGLSPGWNDLGADTAITGTTFRANFAAVYSTRQALLNKIAELAGTVATWAGVSGSGKPADNATRNAVTYGSSAPGSPVDGDLWVDTGGTFAVFKLRSAGAWVTGANALSAYNALSGTPVSLADINSTESTKLTGIADGATVNRLTYSGSAPGSPVDGDLWVDTSGSPAVIKLRVSGAWQSGANLSTGALAMLNAVGMAHITDNSATVVSESYSAGPLARTTSGNYKTVTTTNPDTVSRYVIVHLHFTYTATATGAGASIVLGFGDGSSPVGIEFITLGASASKAGAHTVSGMFLLGAGATGSYSVFLQVNSGALSASELSGVNMRTELIIK